ncbi:MAG: glycosyltransferase family 9 protein, partial [Alphaproteobacteria bacterium]|nr:glycosyltransferase family 9 protein [Alphaproteobacteria bacterium]
MVASSPLNPRNILVYVGLDLVGDGLIKIPFVRALRETFPKAHITWMAGKGKSAFSSLLKPIVDPLLDTVIENQKFGTGFKDLFKKQVTTHYDLIIDTQNGFLTALNLKKIPHTTFISSAFNFLLSDIKYTAGKLPTSLGERLVAFVNMLRKRPLNTLPPLPISEEMKSEINRLLPQNLLPYVGLVPGAGGKHKCWPLENFCELAQWLLTQKTQPVFLIGPQEIDWIDSIKAKVPGALFPLQKESSFKYSPLLTIALGLRLKFV